MDVSSDLTELGRTPIAVVCAGAKSILDIPRTLEVLETQVRRGAGRRRRRRCRAGQALRGADAPVDTTHGPRAVLELWHERPTCSAGQ